ncbi:MAG: M20 family metallopeptidase [Candidatus Lokiarchaeota archaeon]|nr:M20 family metallopeptidase [Candidatus Lokiarchaeota archaeon]
MTIAPDELPIDEREIIELAQKLVQIPSENQPGNEKAVGEYIAAWLKDKGLPAQLQEVEKDRFNVISSIRSCKGEGDPALLLCGHMDTVPVANPEEWSYDPFGGEIKDGYLFGRGALDMKGSLACMLTAFVALKELEEDLSQDVVFLATVDEEVATKGAKKAMESPDIKRVKHGIIAEPTDLNPVIVQKGHCWLKIKTRGVAAHGALPERGVNAILKMYPILSRIQELDFGKGGHPLVSETTVNIGLIQGGVKINMVPDSCETSLDFRFPPGVASDSILGKLTTLLEELKAEDKELDAKVEIIKCSDPVEVQRDAPIVNLLLKAMDKVLGSHGKRMLLGVPYYTDASALRGIPIVLLGPGEPGYAHQKDERIKISSMLPAAKIYATVPLL